MGEDADGVLCVVVSSSSSEYALDAGICAEVCRRKSIDYDEKRIEDYTREWARHDVDLVAAVRLRNGIQPARVARVCIARCNYAGYTIVKDAAGRERIHIRLLANPLLAVRGFILNNSSPQMLETSPILSGVLSLIREANEAALQRDNVR
jgi:hypothetical protein